MNTSAILHVVRSIYRDYRVSTWMPDNKVYLISYPKCGITWLRVLITHVLEKKYSVAPKDWTIRLQRTYKSGKYPGFPNISWSHDDAHLSSENGRRNDPHKVFAYGGRLKYRDIRVVFLVRDPRDVVISQYYQLCYRTRNPFKFDSFSDYLRDQVYGIRRIVNFYRLWYWNSFLLNRFHLIRYEDLVNSPEDELFRLMNFLGIEVKPDWLSYAVEQTQPEKLREDIMRGERKAGRSQGEGRDFQKVREPGAEKYKTQLNTSDLIFANHFVKKLPSFFGYV